jgi:predicted O-methyltransferase YrrM
MLSVPAELSVMSAKAFLRSAAARLISKLPAGLLVDPRFFELYQQAGWHVTPVHYYFPIPDTRELMDELWESTSDLVGIEMNEADQVHLATDFHRDYAAELEPLSGRVPYGQGFGAVDAEVLYCMIRRFRPKRILEIGSGVSTRVMAEAILRNRAADGHDCQLVAIEPFPNEDLRRGFPGLAELRAQKVQQVPLDEFTALAENDFLFIDSSHVCKIGSDVNYEFLEVIPRLAQGVLVHVHDVFTPAEYRKEWILQRHAFWTEQYLLQAFLAFNREFAVRWASSFMHLRNPELMARCFARYDRRKHWPSSFWMQRVGRA